MDAQFLGRKVPERMEWYSETEPLPHLPIAHLCKTPQ